MARPSKKVLAVLGASGALAIGIAVPVTAFAGDNKSASSVTQSDRDTDRAQAQEKLAAALAKELGIDQQKVAAALTKVQEQLRSEAKRNGDKTEHSGDRAARPQQLKTRLDQAVKDGKLTRAEADAIVKAVETGVLPGGGGPGGHGRNLPPSGR